MRHFDLRGAARVGSSSSPASSSHTTSSTATIQHRNNNTFIMDCQSTGAASRFPGKRTFRRADVDHAVDCNADDDDELGLSLKRIRLDSGGSTSHQQQRGNTILPPLTPGELCVRRDIGDSLANGVLMMVSGSYNTYLYGPNSNANNNDANATLRQIEPGRFLFSLLAAGHHHHQQQQGDGGSSSSMVTISIGIPKRYPHHPPSLTIIPGSSSSGCHIVVDQQRLTNLISTTPVTTATNNHHHHHHHPLDHHHYDPHHHLWSPVHRLTDVLGWIVHFYSFSAAITTIATSTYESAAAAYVGEALPQPQRHSQPQQSARMEHSRFRN
jgi:hypothetical protein